MATFSVEGTGELKAMLDDLANIPDDVVDNILLSMGEVALNAQRDMGKALKVYDPEWDGQHVLDSFTLSKVTRKDGIASCFISFKGKRKRGNKETRNAEIAFLNEFGVPQRRGKKVAIEPKQFIGKANVLNEDKIIEAGVKVWDDYLDKNT